MVQQDRAKNITRMARCDEPIRFESLSEYACAKLLEEYTNWRAHTGATFQIPVGRTVFDFRIEDTLVEYHPISLRREFLTDALGSIMSAAHRLSRADKLQLMEAISKELAAQYAKRRAQTLSAHPTYKDMDFICVHSPDEFIRQVVYRFANRRCPSVKQLEMKFRQLQNSFRLD